MRAHFFEHFQCETLRISLHTAWRFAKKTRFSAHVGPGGAADRPDEKRTAPDISRGALALYLAKTMTFTSHLVAEKWSLFLGYIEK